MAVTEIDLLASRLERVEDQLRELGQRLTALEGVRPPAHQTPPPLSTDQPTHQPTDQPLFALIGRSILIVGGGYLIRSLTEMGLVPQAGGVILGFVYALVWIAIADRNVARGRRMAGLFDASTAALIAGALIWESTTRFHYFPPTIGSLLLGIAALALIGIASHRKSQAIAIVAAVMLTFTSIGLAVSTVDVLSPAIAATAAGVVALRLRLQATVTLIFASVSDFLAIALMAIAALERAPYSRGAIELTLLGIAAAWVLAIETAPRYPENFQTAAAMVVGFGGASLFAFGSLTLALLWSALGVATAAIPRPQWRAQAAIWAFGGMLAAFFAGVPAIGGLAVAAFLLVPRDARVSRFALLAIVAAVLLATVNAMLIAPDRAVLAMERSILLALAAVVLSLLGRVHAEGWLLSRIVLVFAAGKFLIEDLRMGRATTIGIALAAYGIAMVFIARSKKETS